jgi:hypothetical protein
LIIVPGIGATTSLLIPSSLQNVDGFFEFWLSFFAKNEFFPARIHEK